VRRLAQSRTNDGPLNPFIEKRSDGARTGHSPATTTASSLSPKPHVVDGDVVVAGPEPSFADDGVRPEFAAALQRALGLSDAELEVVRGLDPRSTTPFVANTLCAVRWA